MVWHKSLKPLSQAESIVFRRGLLKPCKDCYLLKICDYDCKLYEVGDLLTGECTFKCDSFQEK